MLNLIIIVIKKLSNPTHVSWVGLDICDRWVEFFLTHHGGLGHKNLLKLTQSDPCTHYYFLEISDLGINYSY